MSHKRLLAFALTGLLAAVSPAAAQTTGAIRGTVTDPDRAPVAGATITVSSDALLGGSRTTTTGANGAYAVLRLPVGDYLVRVEKEGFQAHEVAGVRVSINSTATQDVALTIAEVTEELTVTGEAAIVDVTESSVGSNYDWEFIEDLPTQRNFYDMISVSPGITKISEGSDRHTAFGSNVQSNAWHIDGQDASAPETGSPWWYINPDTVEEVQVLGIGAPAEFGNFTGAAFNVVTKSGGNEIDGTFNAYYQDDSLTDENADLAGIGFHRERFHDLTGTIGGPFKRDRVWYFGALETFRDGSTGPGVDPNFTPILKADRYDLKISSRLNDSNYLDAKLHYEDWSSPDAGDAFTAPSALGGEKGTNPGGGLNYSSVLSDRLFFDATYSYWWGDDTNESQTGSTEPNFTDYSPAGGGPPVSSGGVIWPWTYETWQHQFDAKLSYFAEEFLGGDHDFRFGIRYSNGNAETEIAPGATGAYYYRYAYEYYGYVYEYFYKYEQNPFIYGGRNENVAAFVDDSWRINDRLTVNLGLRYDYHRGWIPDYDRLDSNFNPTGVKVPGVDPVFSWNNLAPRVGLAYVLTGDQKTVLRASAGVYYDANVSGNWDFPPPGLPTSRIFALNPETGQYDILVFEFTAGNVAIDPDLEAPQATQYALGVERQIGTDYAVGAQLLYKDTENLVGWEVLADGTCEDFVFTDPFDPGNQFTLCNIVEQPTIRKGNEPGFTANPGANEYFQEYRGLFLTFRKRYSDGWSLQANYTLSESEGLIPRMLSQTQFNPFYGSLEGADPNNFINADQLLQGDRKHMFRVQANFELPWNLEATTIVNLQTGRPYNRQIRLLLNQGLTTFITDPASDDVRLPDQYLVDLGIGKRFNLPRGMILKTDLQVLNLLNDDANDFWETLRLQEGDVLVPDEFLAPRRLMLRVGLEF